MRRKKKKGETAVWPQIHPKGTVPKSVLIDKLNFQRDCVAGTADTITRVALASPSGDDEWSAYRSAFDERRLRDESAQR